MSRKIHVLMPEPITLMDDESQSASCASNSSSDRAGFVVQRAQVSDCTVVTGENGSKFTVWKVTLVMEPFDDLNDACRPTIVLYKRYSEFYRFREQLARQCQLSNRSTADLPCLPPRVKWYDTWRYQDVNLNKVWLAKRRQGLNLFLNKVLLNHELVAANKDLVMAFLERQPAVNGF